MLARKNRIVDGREYRSIVRRGSRVVRANTISYVVTTGDHDAVRFGFIVARNVGIAVERNRVRRRLKAASFDMRECVAAGTHVVIRALPSAKTSKWNTLRDEIFHALIEGSTKK